MWARLVLSVCLLYVVSVVGGFIYTHVESQRIPSMSPVSADPLHTLRLLYDIVTHDDTRERVNAAAVIDATATARYDGNGGKFST